MNINSNLKRIIKNHPSIFFFLAICIVPLIFHEKSLFLILVSAFLGYYSVPFLFGYKKNDKNRVIITIGEIISLLFIIYITQNLLPEYVNYITFMDDFKNLFILTLTLLLVYGTFALLSFNLLTVLKSFKKHLNKKEENSADIDKNIDYSLKSGLIFLSATMFSAIGCFMLYIAFILNKVHINSFIQIYNLLSTYGFADGYYFGSFALLILSVLLFIRGLIVIYKGFDGLFEYM